jgi:hypothetical protein
MAALLSTDSEVLVPETFYKGTTPPENLYPETWKKVGSQWIESLTEFNP